MVGLAKAMPDAAISWRPMEGVRSTSEVLMLIASDDYFIPAMLDIPAPAETGITKEYPDGREVREKAVTRDQAISEVQKSFAFLRKWLTDTPDAKLDTPVTAAIVPLGVCKSL